VLFLEMILVALQSVRANLFRAILTMLGIIIGVASVITMVAIGTGARAAVDEQIEALGASVLNIRAGNFMRMGVAQAGATLVIGDAIALTRDARTIDAVVPEAAQQLQVKFGAENRNLRVAGVTPNFATVNGYRVAAGTLFGLADDAAKRPVAVLGSAVPSQLKVPPEALLGATV
jgi:ABC-type antimicrobial peptide transport system permease subunit